MTQQNSATALATVQYRPTELTTERLGDVLVRSGFFKDAKDANQAIVKVLMGRELGLGPIASMMGIHVIEGKPCLSAGLIASAIQRSGLYRYRVKEWTDKACELAFFEGTEALGTFRFTLEDAQRAGVAHKQVWKAYPKAMLFARAMSAGARAYAPAVFNGAVYVPEEMGAEVNEDGEPVQVIEQPARPASEPTPIRPMPQQDAIPPRIDAAKWLANLAAAFPKVPDADEPATAEEQRAVVDMLRRTTEGDVDAAKWLLSTLAVRSKSSDLRHGECAVLLYASQQADWPAKVRAVFEAATPGATA